jgi:hypothetical protein
VKTTFTPGAWQAIIGSLSGGGLYIMTNSDKGAFCVRWIAHVFPVDGLEEECTANANLISGAPEMYSALEISERLEKHRHCCDECLSGGICTDGWDLQEEFYFARKSALAKVRGEQS